MNGLDLSVSLENAERALQFINRDYTLADWKYEKLKEQIEEFQADLTDDVDVCILKELETMFNCMFTVNVNGY